MVTCKIHFSVKIFDNHLHLSNIFCNFAVGKENIMTPTDVIHKITQVGKDVLPPGGHLWLYGSRARGDAHPTSDWDLLVLLDQDKLRDEDYDHISYPFTMLSCDIGEIVNPVMYTKREWESYSFTPFYHNVQHDKIVLL